MKDFIIRILENAKGDDYIRAQKAFSGQDLSEKYGLCTQTKQEMLNGYKAYEDKIEQAIKWVEEGKNETT